MPSGLINTDLTSLWGGVSQQYEEGRYDSQVSEMINCVPSIARGVLRRNPLEYISTLNIGTSSLDGSFIGSYDRGTDNEQYIIVIPGDGKIFVFNANDGIKKAELSNDYLKIPSGKKAVDCFKILTLGDHTFVVNTTKEVKLSDEKTSTNGYTNMAFYWIKKTISITENQKQITSGSKVVSGSLTRGYTYRLNNSSLEAYQDSRPDDSGNINTIHYNSSTLIAKYFADHPTDSLATEVVGSVAYNKNFTGNSWTWSDSFGNEASLGVWTTIDDAKKLPVLLPRDLDGFIVKVSGGTSEEFDDYYLKYNFDNKYWKEIAAPGSRFKLDDATMPHVLYRLSNGSFKFDTYQGVALSGNDLDGVSQWGKRTSGIDNSDYNPSFVDTSIKHIFFYKNRLGFLTDNSIILSKTNDFGSFFPTTIQTVLDDDPIDLAVASRDVTILRHSVSTSGSLLLFSDDEQFILDSYEGPLTPKSANIRPLTTYLYNKNTPATVVGNKIYFSSIADQYAQILTYRISDLVAGTTELNNMTVHLPTYIDKDIKRIIGHSSLGYVFLNSCSYRNKIYVLNTVDKMNKDLQNAFHIWEFKENIAGMHVIQDKLYIIFITGNFCYINLELPGKIKEVNYIDKYSNTNTKEYISFIKFSKFFIRDINGHGTRNGRLQIRNILYTINKDSKYKTTVSSNGYIREYINDEKVTVMANNNNVEIQFESFGTSGFELVTLNLEAFFHQRSIKK